MKDKIITTYLSESLTHLEHINKTGDKKYSLYDSSQNCYLAFEVSSDLDLLILAVEYYKNKLNN